MTVPSPGEPQAVCARDQEVCECCSKGRRQINKHGRMVQKQVRHHQKRSLDQREYRVEHAIIDVIDERSGKQRDRHQHHHHVYPTGQFAQVVAAPHIIEGSRQDLKARMILCHRCGLQIKQRWGS